MAGPWKYEKWDSSNAWIWEPSEDVAGAADLTITVVSGYGTYHIDVICEPDDGYGWEFETIVDGTLEWNNTNGSPQDLLDQVEEWVRTQILAKENKKPTVAPKWSPLNTLKH